MVGCRAYNSSEHLGLIHPEPVGVETDFMKPAPTPNPDEFGSPEDSTVADPMSEDLEALWNGTAQRNRAIFSELFRSVPSDTVRNFEQYKVSRLSRNRPYSQYARTTCPRCDQVILLLVSPWTGSNRDFQRFEVTWWKPRLTS